MEKRRIIVDYKNITSEQLSLITDRYPEGFAPEDMISFKNSKGETVRAVPLETSDTKYLFKVSIEMERRMEAFMDEDDDSDTPADAEDAPDEDVAEDLED
jgi:DNA-directed RNA polymerase subunit delta